MFRALAQRRNSLFQLRRCSSVSLHGVLERTRILKNASQLSLAIPAKSESFEFLYEPSEFYDALVHGVKNAERRVTLAALYLGGGKPEKHLVEVLKQKLASSKDVKINLLLDCVRSERGGSDSSLALLGPLVTSYPSQFSVSLYHTPALRGLLKRLSPPRYNETLGVSHIKAFVFDDDVLMSGANLSEIYFTNRQDRYLRVKQNTQLADYFTQLTQAVGTGSFTLSGDMSLVPPVLGDPLRSSQRQFKRNLLREITTRMNIPEQAYDTSILKAAVQESTETVTTATTTAVSPLGESPFDGHDTFIVPSVQMGPIGIFQDSLLTKQILAAEGGELCLMSAYFNVTKEYTQSILNSAAAFDIISASPEANGFYGAKGLSRHIPSVYTLIERQFFEMIAKRKDRERTQLFEYAREGWTFHGKGLYRTLAGESMPCITMIGSPNFGRRSVERDLEAQITIITKCPQLMQALQEEMAHIRRYTHPVGAETFARPDRKIVPFVRVSTPIIRNMM